MAESSAQNPFARSHLHKGAVPAWPGGPLLLLAQVPLRGFRAQRCEFSTAASRAR